MVSIRWTAEALFQPCPQAHNKVLWIVIYFLFIPSDPLKAAVISNALTEVIHYLKPLQIHQTLSATSNSVSATENGACWWEGRSCKRLREACQRGRRRSWYLSPPRQPCRYVSVSLAGPADHRPGGVLFTEAPRAWQAGDGPAPCRAVLQRHRAETDSARGLLRRVCNKVTIKTASWQRYKR